MKTNWKERVRADAIKGIEKWIGSPDWLNSSVPFNHRLGLKNDQKEILDMFIESLGIPRRKENHRNLEILLANLLHRRYKLINSAKRPIRVSLNKTDWKITRYTRAGESTTNRIYELEDSGYIKLKKGYRTKKESRISRMWPTDKLLKHFPKYDNVVVNDPKEVVELHDNKKKLIDYEDTARTRKIREILIRVNKVNNSACIRFNNYNLYPVLTAIFIRKFTLYGRLHTRGYRHYQGLGPDERNQITINNEPIVELDFSGMHPYLLYAKEGIQLQEDPYSIIDSRPVVRNFLKHILLCMLNSKDDLAAERAANYWLYKHKGYRFRLYGYGISNVRPLMDEFRKAHNKIAHHFCNGSETGLRIMNLDSRIALDIVDHFSKQSIPILAVHDSFIVQDKYRDELWQTMHSKYKKHTKGYECKIK